MTNPTERPEERDLLEAIEMRFAAGYAIGERDDAAEWNLALADLRTLINEVKGLREENARLAVLNAETKANLDEATARMLAHAKHMDEMAAQILELSAITQRAAQMEEALRELLDPLDVTIAASWPEYKRALAALSPSDTEEEA